MLNFLYTADWHLRGSNPKNRKGDYVEDVKAKLLEVAQLARAYNCKLIVVPGDIWDSFVVSIAVLLDYVDFIQETFKGLRIVTTYGQHDVQGYNVESYYRTSLRLTERLLGDMFKVCKHGDALEVGGVLMTFEPYSKDMDVGGYGYSPDPVYDAEVHQGKYKIHVAHGTLLAHKPPFDKYTLIDDVYTTADMILTGDYHPGYGIVKRADGKIFCNPGSLTRLKASEAEMDRTIQVALITVDQGVGSIKLLPLQSAKPGDEVLDRSKIEEEKARDYAMSKFTALVKGTDGQAVALDVNQIIEAMAQKNDVAPDIVEALIAEIDAQREAVD